MFDFSEATIADLALNECGLDLADCDFVGMTLKAGNNAEDGYSPQQAAGEGEIIFGDIEEDYGALNRPDCEILAENVIDDLMVV